jgi:proteasome assembly chaperone (PAC2) family protein
MLDNIKIKDIDDKEMNYTISITINIEWNKEYVKEKLFEYKEMWILDNEGYKKLLQKLDKTEELKEDYKRLKSIMNELEEMWIKLEEVTWENKET